MLPKAIHLLLVEDSPTDALMLRVALEDVRSMAFELVHVERLGEALCELERQRFDVIVLDMGLPDSAGLDGLVKVRQAAEEAPILLLTGVDDEETAVAAVERGAQDYLVKGKVDGSALTRAIRYAISRKRGEQLQLAKEDAEAANRAKDHFLAILSHELRTPLTPVLTLIDLLEAEADLPDRLRTDIQTIRRNVELERHLIDDLLDVTRIVRGKLELRKEPVELSQVIRSAAEVCQPDISARGLEFGVDLGKDTPYIIEADAIRLQQVFWNLLKNAIKFTPHGGCVGVRCRLVDGHVAAEVNDSGVGIEPHHLALIFNAFEQGDRAITQRFGGLGLGLAISRAIIELHGGSITARSAGRNQGATFEVRLPLVPGPAKPIEKPMLATKATGAAVSILLVEDHGDTARALARLLGRQGYQVQCAGDIATALISLSRGHFDLLISDMGLPDGTGIDLLRQARAAYPNLPAIALSGYGREDDVQRSRQAGFAAHLVKPATQRDLLEAISNAVAHGSHR
jgi:two-component system CheB/CheR fusion protein